MCVRFGPWLRLVSLTVIWCVTAAGVPAQVGWSPDRSVSWQQAQAGFQPGQGAIAGGRATIRIRGHRCTCAAGRTAEAWFRESG